MNEDLPLLISETKAIAAEVEKTFGGLTVEQLNWKPQSDAWSIAQCFDHLMVIDSGYFPLIEKIAKGQYTPTFQQRLPLLPRFFGSMILKAVQPQAQRKFKAAIAFQPASSSIGGDIIAKFMVHQQQVAEHMKLTENSDLQKIIITSPVASFATYSLLDAYKILVAHERRHMAQAARVMNNEAFPKS